MRWRVRPAEQTVGSSRERFLTAPPDVMTEPHEPAFVRMAMEYLGVTPDLAAALWALRLGVVHDFGPGQDEFQRLAIERADEVLSRFRLIDPVSFAAFAGDEHAGVDALRARVGRNPEGDSAA